MVLEIQGAGGDRDILLLSVNAIFLLPEPYYPWLKLENVHPEQQHE